jgi:hypothetical protein
MKKVRKSVFETNSSSTHSICIAKEAVLNIPKTISFNFGEFGWEIGTIGSDSGKASYLYTGLVQNERREDIEKLKGIMSKHGIEAAFEEGEDGYVDHGDELSEFLDAVMEDEGKLMHFLFSGMSFVNTGNDNDDHEVDFSVSYPHDEYYKGN